MLTILCIPLLSYLLTHLLTYLHDGCGSAKRVNYVYFLETWLKILNNLTRLKVGYNKL